MTIVVTKYNFLRYIDLESTKNEILFYDYLFKQINF